MSEQDKKQYDLEPSDEGEDSMRAELEPAQPLGGDDEVAPDASDVQALDVCPNCGASMRGADALVCMRCGFDLKTMKKIETHTGDESVDEEANDEVVPPPLSPPGRGDLWIPGLIAGVCVLVLIIGYAGGVQGLFEGSIEPNFGARLVAVLQLVIRLLVWGGCAVGALWCTARLINQQPLGDIRLVAMRALAAMAVINLVRFINLENDAWEMGIELVLQALLYPVMLLSLFGMALRDAAWTSIITIATLLAMVLAPLIVSWSM